jgi:hypothetical protein
MRVAVYRTTGYAWPEGGAVAAVDYPDEDRVQAFRTGEQGTVTAWPDVLGRSVRLCAGEDCSGTVYFDITSFDWTFAPLTIVTGNGLSESYAYDFRGGPLTHNVTRQDRLLYAETLRDMQIANGENLRRANSRSRRSFSTARRNRRCPIADAEIAAELFRR